MCKLSLLNSHLLLEYKGMIIWEGGNKTRKYLCTVAYWINLSLLYSVAPEDIEQMDIIVKNV